MGGGGGHISDSKLEGVQDIFSYQFFITFKILGGGGGTCPPGSPTPPSLIMLAVVACTIRNKLTKSLFLFANLCHVLGVDLACELALSRSLGLKTVNTK